MDRTTLLLKLGSPWQGKAEIRDPGNQFWYDEFGSLSPKLWMEDIRKAMTKPLLLATAFRSGKTQAMIEASKQMANSAHVRVYRPQHR